MGESTDDIGTLAGSAASGHKSQGLQIVPSPATGYNHRKPPKAHFSKFGGLSTACAAGHTGYTAMRDELAEPSDAAYDGMVWHSLESSGVSREIAGWRYGIRNIASAR
jgi:hypothetical protein